MLPPAVKFGPKKSVSRTTKATERAEPSAPGRVLPLLFAAARPSPKGLSALALPVRGRRARDWRCKRTAAARSWSEAAAATRSARLSVASRPPVSDRPAYLRPGRRAGEAGDATLPMPRGAVFHTSSAARLLADAARSAQCWERGDSRPGDAEAVSAATNDLRGVGRGVWVAGMGGK
eukprot:scaffold7031_cov118-Isochrysis_galbana.AAC.6